MRVDRCINVFVFQVHLSSNSTACLMMNHEYIVPMTEQTREITLFPSSENGVTGGNGATHTSHGTSLKPQLHFSPPCFVRSGAEEGDCTDERGCADSPEIPLDKLKDLTVEMLTAGVWAVGQGVRDPVGGSTELLLVPLIRLFYTLLVIGVFRGEDLGKVLRLIEPGVFSTDPEPTEQEEEEEEQEDDENGEESSYDEKDWTGANKMDRPKHGLLQMKLPEAVKLEVPANIFDIFVFIEFTINH